MQQLTRRECRVILLAQRDVNLASNNSDTRERKKRVRRWPSHYTFKSADAGAWLMRLIGTRIINSAHAKRARVWLAGRRSDGRSSAINIRERESVSQQVPARARAFYSLNNIYKMGVWEGSCCRAGRCEPKLLPPSPPDARSDAHTLYLSRGGWHSSTDETTKTIYSPQIYSWSTLFN
jgi:hypothetical protein